MKFDSLCDLFLESAAVRSYSCLMLDLRFLQSEIEQIQENICPCDIYDAPGHGLEDEFHTTILHGIHETKPYEVFSKLDLTPIHFKIQGLSLFKNDKYDVLKFDIKSRELTALNKQVCERLAYTNDYPKYHPHATVAYLQPKSGKYYLKLKNRLEGKSFTSNRFIFSDPTSQKVIHTVR
jgi:hypothetical protein